MHHVLVARRTVVYALITLIFLGILISILWALARDEETARSFDLITLIALSVVILGVAVQRAAMKRLSLCPRCLNTGLVDLRLPPLFVNCKTVCNCPSGRSKEIHVEGNTYAALEIVQRGHEDVPLAGDVEPPGRADDGAAG